MRGRPLPEEEACGQHEAKHYFNQLRFMYFRYNRTSTSSTTSSGQLRVYTPVFTTTMDVDEARLEKTYSFPKGNADVERLELQHQICVLRFGGLYPEEIEGQVQHLMTQRDSEVLDVGCGSSPIWSTQMAKRFPKVNITGLDLAPLTDGEYPKNFSFVRHDLTKGFPDEYKNRFSILHCRLVCQQFPDPPMLIKGMADCLKPNGLLLLIDGGGQTYGQDKKPVTPFKYDPSRSITENLKNTEGGSWHAGWFAELGRGVRSPTFKPPPELIRQTPLKEIMSQEYLVPYGWEGGGIRNGKKLGDLMMKNAETVYKFSPAILARLNDLPDEIKKALVTKGFQELKGRKMYIHLWYTVGMRSE
ncbi:hypothetical protein D9756_002068 [Leucocoprinus leucothites]|uniref:S-adenosyl-L-methionine-dependent methyltransferase n=1 Tax=Leucocoprinus leucothites TaxID=201217 RepID=A0A8H5GC93_9AGAR|nr:hypothetical protein D9756_002068 [Leucoagaricus leucothites]